MLAALLTENESRCNPPLDRNEVEAIAKSIGRYEPGEQIKSYALTDTGNSEQLAAQHGEKIRYCFAWKKWLIWTGSHWQIDSGGKINQLAKQTIRGIYREAAACIDDNQRQSLVKHARASESAGRIHAMIELAKNEAGISVVPEDLDSYHWRLNCLNGTIDLRTGDLEPHRPEVLNTKILPIAYESSAAFPTWERFLSEVFEDNHELIWFIQKAIGYSLSGDTS